MLYSLSRKEGWRRYVDAPARQRPEPLTAGQLKRLGGAARQEYDEARHDWHANFGILRTPQLAAVHEELEVIVAAGRCDPDRVRGAAVIDALPGLGTPFSAEAARYARRLAARQDRWPDPQAALAGLLARWDQGMVSGRRERRMAVRLAAEHAAPAVPEAAEAQGPGPQLQAAAAEGDDDDAEEIFDTPGDGDFYADAFEVLE